jgi:hypothetical protein
VSSIKCLSLEIANSSVERCEDGYPYLATFLDSDENFMIYRRFGFIHARLLLQKQDELRIMEEELDRMDQQDLTSNPRAIQCRMEDIERQDNQPGAKRQALLARLEETVLRYDELLLNARQLAAANRPPERDYNSVANFIRHKKPLMQGDDDFIYNKEDLITLRPGRESAWLDATVERFLKLFPRSAVKFVFCSKVRLTINKPLQIIKLTFKGNRRQDQRRRFVSSYQSPCRSTRELHHYDNGACTVGRASLRTVPR